MNYMEVCILIVYSILILGNFIAIAKSKESRAYVLSTLILMLPILYILGN